MIAARREARHYTLHRDYRAALHRAWSAVSPFVIAAALFAATVIADRITVAADVLAMQQEADARIQKAEQERDEIAAWHARNTARVTIEGDASRVANIAGQVAAVVR